MINRRTQLLCSSPPPSDGQPKGNRLSNPTEQKALVLAEVNKQIEAIEQTMIELKTKYSNTCTGEVFEPYEAFIDYGMFCYYRSKPIKEIAPAPKSWSRYRWEFAYKVAEKLKIIL